jgi:hypothetical protein
LILVVVTGCFIGAQVESSLLVLAPFIITRKLNVCAVDVWELRGLELRFSEGLRCMFLVWGGFTIDKSARKPEGLLGYVHAKLICFVVRCLVELNAIVDVVGLARHIKFYLFNYHRIAFSERKTSFDLNE